MDLSESGQCSSGSSGVRGTATVTGSPRTRTNVTRPPPPSSPTKCAICLGDLVNRCYTNSCLHQFCFPCLHEWSKVKPECPLCKSHFQTIYHNIRNNDDFDEYRVPVLNLPPSISNLSIRDHFGTTFSLESYPHRHPYPAHTHMHIFRDSPQGSFGAPYHDHGYSFHRLVSDHHRHHPPRTNPTDFYHIFPPHRPHNPPAGFENQDNPFQSDEPETFGSYEETHRRAHGIIGYQGRRRIYDRHQFVEPFSRTLPPGTVFFPSVDYFNSHPRSARRVKDWLYREILVLCSLTRSRTEMAHLYDTIINMLFRYDIRSAEFRAVVQPYFQGRTRHFQHEFYHFALSGMGLAEYDRSATYNTSAQEDPRLNRNQESSATVSRPSEPEVVTLDSDDSSDDDEVGCVITHSHHASPESPAEAGSGNARACSDIEPRRQTRETVRMRTGSSRPQLPPALNVNSPISPPSTRPSFSLTSIYTVTGPVDIIDEGYVDVPPSGNRESQTQRPLTSPHYHRVPFSAISSGGYISDYMNPHPRSSSIYPVPSPPPREYWDGLNCSSGFTQSSHADPVTNSDYSRRHHSMASVERHRSLSSMERTWNPAEASPGGASVLDWDHSPASHSFRPMIIVPPAHDLTTYTNRRTPPASPLFNSHSPISVFSPSPIPTNTIEDSDTDEIELLGTFPVEKKPPLATITISSDSEDESKRVKVEKQRKSPPTEVEPLDSFLVWNSPPTTSRNDPQPSTSRGLVNEVLRSVARKRPKRKIPKRKEADHSHLLRKQKKTNESQKLKSTKKARTQKVYAVDSESSSGCLDLSLQVEISSSSLSSFDDAPASQSSDSDLEPSSTDTEDEAAVKLAKKVSSKSRPKIKPKRTNNRRIKNLLPLTPAEVSSSSSSSDDAEIWLGKQGLDLTTKK